MNEELGLYDYGARWYDPAVARWSSVDPLAGEMPGWSPYNYVLGNPILRIDPDGRDGRVRHDQGDGTKDNPHVITITANYYYNQNDISSDELSALNSAIGTYNSSSHSSGKSKKGTYTVYKYELSAVAKNSDSEALDAALGDTFEGASGGTRQFGNVIKRTNDSGDSALAFDLNGKSINLNDPSMSSFVESGGDLSDGLKSTFLHEIGHNLGGEHSDPGPMGAHVSVTYRNADPNCLGSGCKQVPSTERKGLSRKFTPAVINRISNPNGRRYLDYEK